MGKRDYFPLFLRYRESFAGLTEEQVGRIILAAIDYAADGKTPRLSPVENMAFAFIRGDIDRAARAYEERCEKNRRAAEQRWGTDENESSGADANACERMQADANDAKQTINQSINQSSNIPSGGITRARARGGTDAASGGEGDKGFAAPDAETVRQYCEEAGITVDAERFVEHYGSLGWRKGGQQIRDWKALCRKWAREDREKAAADAGKTDPGFSSFDADEYFNAALKRTYGDA